MMKLHVLAFLKMLLFYLKTAYAYFNWSHLSHHYIFMESNFTVFNYITVITYFSQFLITSLNDFYIFTLFVSFFLPL